MGDCCANFWALANFRLQQALDIFVVRGMFAESYALPHPQFVEEYAIIDRSTNRDIICSESPDFIVGESPSDSCLVLLRIWCVEVSIVSRYSMCCTQIPPRP